MFFQRYIRIAIIIGWLAGCAPVDVKPSLTKYRETRVLMGTVVQLDVCHRPAEEVKLTRAYEAAWERLEEIHWRMSVFDPKSDVSKINGAEDEAVAIGSDTYQLIEDSFDYAETTRGAFDITVWPLIRLWQEAEEINQMPGPAELAETLHNVGIKNLHLLPGNRVKKLNPDVLVDLGGIAKGYAVDEAARIFRQHGFRRFFIDAGGDIYVGGYNCKNEPWRIGIRDPREESAMIDIIHLSNTAVATSGDYEQHYTIAGRKWSHIINPITGYPQKDVVSVTVIGPRASEADAYATAFSLLTPSKAQQLIRSLGSEYASLILEQAEDGSWKIYKDNNYRKRKKRGY